MITGLVHAHSGLRWIVLILLVLSVVNALRKGSGGAFTDGDRKIALFTLIFTHVQLLLGLTLYFTSQKVQFGADMMSNAAFRFYSVEHITIMLIAIALITVGYTRMKKGATDRAKWRSLLIFYGIGLLLILAGIPWPFRGLGAGWF